MNRIQISAPGRLHMGFLDMGGALGRRFGSIGVGIDELATSLSVEPAKALNIVGSGADRAARVVNRLAMLTGIQFKVSITIDRTIPDHAGLGSGTQLALATGVALSRLYGLNLPVRELAAMVERGARSGIGIGVFEQGGLLVDAGRGPNTPVPPIISRLQMPPDWRFIIVLDRRDQGLHGSAEIEAFRKLPVFPEAEAARLCHLLVMRGLPAVAENELDVFGSVITELQRSVGDHFAPAQGGRFTSPEVQSAVEFLAGQGAVGVGQSSWGPTGFCMVATPASAESLLKAARHHFCNRPELDFLIGTPRNQGAHISG